MNKHINKILIASMAVAAASCTGAYEDINSNPYEPGDLSGDNYALVSQMNAIAGCVMSPQENTAQFTEALLGGTLGGYFSDSNAGFTQSFARYNAKNDWSRVFMKSDEIIPKLYSNLGGLKTSCDRNNTPGIYAIATIIKVAAMSRVTDTYGPIPFSSLDAFSTEVEVPYDSQEAIYREFFNQLTEAVNTLREHPNYLNPAADYVYSGNVDQWIRFANSLKLRLAMRVSKVAPALSKQMAEEAVAGGVIESNTDNAEWDYFGSITNGVYISVNYNKGTSATGGDTHAAADIICYMNGYKDPRRAAYFIPSLFEGTEYVGLRRGWENYNSSWGFNFCGVNIKPNDPYIWMTAAEVAFLRAEGAAIHNYNMGGTAEQFYNRGIELSFEQWGVSGAAEYIADASSRPESYVDPTGLNPYTGTLSTITIKWDESATTDAKLERIITQKWIALWLNGNEAWAEYRRTGYPKLIPVAFNGSGGIVNTAVGPQRLPYPQEEYTNNSYYVAQAVRDLLGGPDNQATKVWWAR